LKQKQRTLGQKIVRYKIPRNELVREVLKSFAMERRVFSSLSEITEEVNGTIKRLNRSYVVSTSRCRKLSTEFFEISATPGSKKSSIDHCPVCGAPLGVVKNKTINGSEITLNYECKTCGYISKGYIRAPARYRFSPKINI